MSEAEHYRALYGGITPEPDEGKYTKEDHEAYRRRVEEAERKRAEEREKANMKAAYLADGGTGAQFERDYESMQAESRKKRLLEREEQARQYGREVSRI